MPIPVPGAVADAVRRQTVHIQVGRGRSQSGGSGVIVSPERVITNAHVVRRDDVSVESWDGKQMRASCLRLDARRDLALLSAPGLQSEPASLGDSDGVRSGAAVFAVGNPLGFVGAVSSGVVHAIGSLGGLAWIQADLRLAPGSSGGPLADFHGQVLGVNTMVVSGGLALAVPSRAVQSFLLRAKAGRMLGVTVRPVELENGKFGIMILELSAGSPAAGASLLPGDILLGADRRPFRFVEDLQFAIDAAPGALLHLDFYRGGQHKLRHVAVQLVSEQAPAAA
jgi:serine protease Do